MPTIEIDGNTLEVEQGKMIIEAADAAGIYIPRFCYHEKLSIAANCRMCLVEVEKAPKPLPACATPVADGMKISTASPLAVDAQKGTMEFLLINHPLDCPVCDQGGECPLQDQALGYGKDISRFSEKKRVVEDKDIGPLIETEMTRCIHCTRCVRFGEEVAGIMELGMTGRGEHSEIGTAIGQTVDSELSGNMVDLCPVGALTNKPYRFTARVWELASYAGISPHDCVGANTNIQAMGNHVKRILPRDNEAVNQCWLSDRDRYSFQAFHSADRLLHPMIKSNGEWQQTDWESALKFAVTKLGEIVSQHGPQQLGALAAPTSSLEEFYLVQKLVRALGSNNVDHRLRQQDFDDDDPASMRPWLGCSIEELSSARAVLLVGSNIRKDQPLLGLRLRTAALQGASIMAVNQMDYAFHFNLSHKLVAAPSRIPALLASIVAAAAGESATDISADLQDWVDDSVNEPAAEIARVLAEAGDGAVIILGNAAVNHPQASILRAMAQALSMRTGARWGSLPAGNGAAAWVAGCVPHRGVHTASETADKTAAGLNAAQMIRSPRKGYLLLGVEPGFDCGDGQRALTAMHDAEGVVALTAYDIRNHVDADVLLPVTPYSESPGSYINCEGVMQSVSAAVAPGGEARPAWKVLRVLGNLFDQAGWEVPGFDYVTSIDVRDEVNWTAQRRDEDKMLTIPQRNRAEETGTTLERIGEVPLYRVDSVIRRAQALQQTRDNPPAMTGLCRAQAERLGLAEGDQVKVTSDVGSISLPVLIDDAVPPGCVFIAAGLEISVPLGSASLVEVTKG